MSEATINQPTFVEYTVIGGYFVFMLITGVVFRRFVKNFSDYFRSGARAAWWLVGSSVFMMSFSAWTFTGAAGVAYVSGITVAVIFLSNTIGYLVNCAITAPLFRQMRAITFPEVVRNRFDTPTQQFYVWLGIVPGIMTASLTLLGVSVFTSAVFGFEVAHVVIVLGVVVLLYCTIGGSWSVMATDVLQALILMPMAALVTFLSLRSIGGLEGLIEGLRAQGLHEHFRLVSDDPTSKFTTGWALAMLVYVLLSYNSMGSSTKYFACKDGRDARKAAGLAAFLMLIGTLLWFIPPIVARLQFASLVEAQSISNPAEASYAVISLQLLPYGMSGLIVVAMFTATMSSLDATLNHIAAVMTQDFYKPFIRPHAPERELFLVGQIASFVVGIGIIAFAVHFSKSQVTGLFDYMLIFGSLLGTPMIVPMFLALFVRRAPVWSAIVAVLYGFLISYLCYVAEARYEVCVFYILLGSSVAFLGTLPFWRRSSDEYRRKVDRFFHTMTKPVDFEKEIGGATDTRQLKLLGWLSVAMSFFIAVLLVLPNPLDGRLQILFVAGCVGGLGGLMLFAAAVLDRLNASRIGPTETSL